MSLLETINHVCGMFIRQIKSPIFRQPELNNNGKNTHWCLCVHVLHLYREVRNNDVDAADNSRGALDSWISRWWSRGAWEGDGGRKEPKARSSLWTCLLLRLKEWRKGKGRGRGRERGGEELYAPSLASLGRSGTGTSWKAHLLGDWDWLGDLRRQLWASDEGHQEHLSWIIIIIIIMQRRVVSWIGFRSRSRRMGIRIFLPSYRWEQHGDLDERGTRPPPMALPSFLPSFCDWVGLDWRRRRRVLEWRELTVVVIVVP